MEANITPLQFSPCAAHSTHWNMGPLSQNRWPQDGRKKNLARAGVKSLKERLPNKWLTKTVTCIMSLLSLFDLHRTSFAICEINRSDGSALDMYKIHLDTDLGGDIDDLCALAMLLRWSGKVELNGITTVAEANGRGAGDVRYVLGLVGRRER